MAKLKNPAARWLGIAWLLSLASLIACQSEPESSSSPAVAPPSAGDSAALQAVEDDISILLLNERFESLPAPADHIDSLVYWSGGPDNWWVIASAKQTDRLNVYDARSGELVRQVGRTGGEAGELRRPHDLATIDDLLLVCERDNARVQVFRLPSFESLGWFGDDRLERPYGLAAHRSDGSESYEIFVGDNYAPVPGERDLSQRIKRFRMRLRGGRLSVDHISSFGESEGDGALSRIETLALDPLRRELLIAGVGSGDIKVYSFDGRFERAFVGDRRLQPQAITLVNCSDGGYVITSEDEFSVSMFQVFEWQTLERVGVFVGSRTRNSDGLVVAPNPFPNFPQGAVFASNNDRSVVAFSWGEIVSAMALELDCVSAGGATGIPAG